MASQLKNEKDLESEKIRDAIRLLEIALEQCHKLLADVESGEHVAMQDNEPPH